MTSWPSSQSVFSDLPIKSHFTPRMQRLLNSADSAYRSETGGLMEALRSLTVEQSKCASLRTLRLFSESITSSRVPQTVLRSPQFVTDNHWKDVQGYTFNPLSSSGAGGTQHYFPWTEPWNKARWVEASLLRNSERQSTTDRKASSRGGCFSRAR